MTSPRIYADFNNTDIHGRLRLNCVGTTKDLARHNVELRNGLTLLVYSDDLDDEGWSDEILAEGVVSYSEDEHVWVAAIDWGAVRHRSERAAQVKK